MAGSGQMKRSPRRFGQHCALRQRGVQMQRNQQPDHDDQGQLAFADADFACGFPQQGVRTRVGWDGLSECLDRQGATEFAFGHNFAYCESPEVAPVVAFRVGARKYATEAASRLMRWLLW
jgi:hypothetical protein